MAALQTYWTKRHFDITKEPRGKPGKRGGNAFVIQKHAATRLHCDLRLELDGVMKSWAVTRGPSLNPGEKRLAVQVEDHPIEYNKFEGTIPQGQYGGGAVPKEETRARNAKWVEPTLVAEVDLRGWTHGNRERQASFQGIREDKSPKEVVREVKAMVTSKGARQAAASARPAAKNPEVAGVTLSHPDRVYWEDAGVTKQDLAGYYTRVWKWMQPHVTGRVLALVRCPEGAAGECFFQKHASAGVDQKRLHLVLEPDGDKSISVADLGGIIALVQAGVLEIHTRGTTIDHLEEADRLVFDLDPGPGIGWKDIVAAARDVRARLAALKLKSFVKTSGGKGLHVVLPIRYTPWEEAKDFCRRIAEQMAADAPDRYTATVKKAARGNRIFIDYLRNSREATAVAPYSSRARPGAPVSAPISWEELKTLKSASHYTVPNIQKRLSRLRSDPWKDIGKLKQVLPAARRMRK